MKVKFSIAVSIAILVAATVRAADWSQWGGALNRNMYSPEKGLPDKIIPFGFIV